MTGLSVFMLAYWPGPACTAAAPLPFRMWYSVPFGLVGQFALFGGASKFTSHQTSYSGMGLQSLGQKRVCVCVCVCVCSWPAVCDRMLEACDILEMQYPVGTGSAWHILFGGFTQPGKGLKLPRSCVWPLRSFT